MSYRELPPFNGPQWEYTVVWAKYDAGANWDARARKWREALDMFGAEGWELVNYVDRPWGREGTMKRLKGYRS